MTSRTAKLQNLMRGLVIQLLVLGLLLPPGYIASSIITTVAEAATAYAEGYSKYQKGDFKGAEKSLMLALKGKMTKLEQAKTLKLLGICQFMANKKSIYTAERSAQSKCGIGPPRQSVRADKPRYNDKRRVEQTDVDIQQRTIVGIASH